MSFDVIAAEYIEDYRIKVSFENGKQGVIDFSPYIERGGIYSKLKDMKLFRKFEIDSELGVITWNKEIDIAPETLYAEATGEPLPDWMGAES